MQTVAARVAPERVDRALDHALALDAEELPETMRQLRRRFPEEPYRQRLGAIAERHPADPGGDDRRDRGARAGGYAGAAALDAELASLQHALVEDGLGRVAWGEVAELRWQLRDVRVPPRLARGPPARRGASGRARGAPDGRRAGRRGRGRGHGGRGAGDVPGDRAAPGEVRRRGVPAVRDLVHDQPRRRRGGAGARAPGRGARAVRPAGRRPHRPAAGPARPRRRPAARERRRAVGRGRAPRRPARRPRLSRPPARSRRRPGGHARLLRLVQGERVPGGQLVPVSGPGGPRRDRAGGTASR